jgi:aminoglycoside phosphotransferase (APT) family kinase protein
MTLHDGELTIDAALVARLLAEQLPAYAGLPLRAWPSTGTVHAIFRLGDDLALRLPRLARWSAAVELEAAWLPRLAPRVSLGVPEPVAVGRPTAAYPASWAVVRWRPGAPYGAARVAAPDRPTACARCSFARHGSAPPPEAPCAS